MRRHTDRVIYFQFNIPIPYIGNQSEWTLQRIVVKTPWPTGVIKGIQRCTNHEVQCRSVAFERSYKDNIAYRHTDKRGEGDRICKFEYDIKIFNLKKVLWPKRKYQL